MAISDKINALLAAETASTGKTNSIISTDDVIHNTPAINFSKKQLVLSDGNPKLTYEIDAIKQWITLFITTPKDAYPIYLGTGFGTSIRSLYGQKQIGYGYEEAMIEQEIKEGFLLCPAIQEVRSVNLEKENRFLKVTVEVELKDGTLITESVEETLNVRL